MNERDAHRMAKEFITENKLSALRVVFTDVHGVLRGKIVSADAYLGVLAEGLRFSETIFSRDIRGRRVDATHLTLDHGGRDYFAKPDPSTYAVLPWRPGLAQVIADLTDSEGTPLPYAPRSVLRRVLARVDAIGIVPRVASELEFYVLRPRSRSPVGKSARPYDVHDLLTPGSFLEEVLITLRSLRLAVETVVAEAGPGQFEVTLHHAPALRMADETVLFKTTVKELASKHGLLATFMAKPFGDCPGSGFHLHQSLWDPSGVANLFASERRPALSPLLLQFVAGQLSHLRGATPFFAPTINAYRRLGPGTFTPSNCTWGLDNRTVALRVPETRGSGARVELRVPGADANPYLVIGAALATGIIGIQDALVPPPPVVGNAYEAHEAQTIPASLLDALVALEEDHRLREVLGEDAVAIMSAVKRAEADHYSRAVSEWERDSYLESA